ncbi:MAG: hypothetical protein MI864_04575 [Pseudomonadales bacterium]|nr:hypothetical protein [Pseudomonadales bacterium]
MAKVILTDADAGNRLSLNNDIDWEIIGTSAADNILVEAGANVDLTALGGGDDTVVLSGDSTEYTVAANGTTVTLTHTATGETVMVPASASSTNTVTFADGESAALTIGTAVMFGSLELANGADAVAVSGTTSGSAPDLGDFPKETQSGLSVVATGTDEGGNLTFVVSLSPAQLEATTVDFAIGLEGGATAADHGDITVDGTVDNTGTGTLTFAAGQTTKTITVAASEDNAFPEDGEGVSLTLSNASGASITTASATATIGDVNPYTLTQGITEVEEGDSVTYTLTTAVPVTEDTTVSFSVVPGDATAANQGTNDTNLNDFDQGSFNPSNVVIPAGSSSAEFTLTTQTDSITELPEDYTLQAVVNGQTITIETTLLDGSGFTLTTGNDAFTGDANDDVFTSGLGTLNNGDVLEGLGGTDTLNSRLSTDAGDPTMDSIDIINMDSRANAATIGLTNASQVGQLSITGTGNGRFDNAQNTVTSFSVAGNTTDGNYNKTALLEFVDDAFTGTADALSLSITNVSGSSATVSVGQAASTGTNNLETLNIALMGTGNTFTFDPNTTVGFDAINSTVITGSADSTITVATADYALTGRSLNASAHTGMLNIITNETGAINAAGLSGIDKLVFTADVNNTITSLAEGSNVEVRVGQTALTVVQTGADTAGSLSDTFTFTMNPAASATQTALTFDAIETVSLVSTTSATDPSTVTNTITTLNADGLGTLNISGAAHLAIGTLTDQVDIVDASTATGNVTLNVNATNTTEAVLYKGSAGVDTINGSGFDDNISGNAGNDVIEGEAGADTLTGGAGADTFVYTTIADSSSATVTSNDSVTDFVAGTDDFDVTNVPASVVAAATGSISAASFNADIDALLTTATANHVQVLTANAGDLNGKSFLVQDTDGDGTFDAGTELLIDITGLTGTLTTADFV